MTSAYIDLSSNKPLLEQYKEAIDRCINLLKIEVDKHCTDHNVDVDSLDIEEVRVLSGTLSHFCEQYNKLRNRKEQ